MFCFVTLARPSVSASSQSLTTLLDTCMHHLTCGISSLLRSVNLILFSLLLVHYVYHLIAVATFALAICHSLGLCKSNLYSLYNILLLSLVNFAIYWHMTHHTPHGICTFRIMRVDAFN